MGNVTIHIKDKTEYAVRAKIFARFKGRGRYMGAYIESALELILERCEEDEGFEETFWERVEEKKRGVQIGK